MESVINLVSQYLKHLTSISEFLIKSDEENINTLLNKPEDKIKFQLTIDELLRDNEKSKTIQLDDKKITISI
jgi:hypothetical protein